MSRCIVPTALLLMCLAFERADAGITITERFTNTHEFNGVSTIENSDLNHNTTTVPFEQLFQSTIGGSYVKNLQSFETSGDVTLLSNSFHMKQEFPAEYLSRSGG